MGKILIGEDGYVMKTLKGKAGLRERIPYFMTLHVPGDNNLRRYTRGWRVTNVSEQTVSTTKKKVRNIISRYRIDYPVALGEKAKQRIQRRAAKIYDRADLIKEDLDPQGRTFLVYDLGAKGLEIADIAYILGEGIQAKRWRAPKRKLRPFLARMPGSEVVYRVDDPDAFLIDTMTE